MERNNKIMSSMPKGNKCCATCLFWSGPRKISTLSVEVPSINVRAKCLNGKPGDATPGPSACSSASCNLYKKIP